MSAIETFPQRFNQCAHKFAPLPAIIERGTRSVSYGQLDERARRGAQALRSGFGNNCADEPIVAICLPKSVEYLVALLSVWYAGAAFVPIDPDLPESRIDYIISESNAKVIVCETSMATRLANSGATVITPEHIRNCEIALAEPTVLNPDKLAYVIFTSGSTGKPKGVQVTHRGIVSLLDSQIEHIGLGPGGRSLFYLSTSFDASISDIGTALLSGATLFIEAASDLHPGPELVSLLHKRQITYVDIPPSVLAILKPEDMPASLKTIVIGGEACRPEVVRNWAKQIKVINVYGPTESTVCTSLCQCDPIAWVKPLIGDPLPGIAYHILDASLNQVQVGEPGELYIGGNALARGYLNQPHLTAEKFIQLDGQRLYKTGDLVVADEHGSIEFLGRIDRQVKLRGLLIEPEEIEKRLLELPGIERACIIKRRVSETCRSDILVAFYTGSSGKTDEEIREHLSFSLPSWMLPHRYENLPSMPVMSSGKVDMEKLKQLPLIEKLSSKERTFGASPLALILQETWAKLLGIEHLGIDDNFFAMGGDSLLVIEAVVAAEAAGIRLSPALLMEYPTIRLIEAELNRCSRGDVLRTAYGALDARDLRQRAEPDMEMWKWLEEAARRVEISPRERPNNILITGGTGFLGANLISELLRRTAAKIYCLVRADSAGQAMQRLEVAARKLSAAAEDAWQEQSFQADWNNRVVPICGDLSQSFFGLDEQQWRRLAEGIDAVYHCAAHVNMLLPYEALEPANVHGTREVIRFLCAGKIKWLHYASTLSVFVATDRNSGVLLEDDELQDVCWVYGGYAQTKFVSECMLRHVEGKAAPVSHYRFGLITGDSKKGKSAPTDFLTTFVRGVAALQAVPDSSHSLEVDVTPVDFAVAAMAHLAERDMAAGVGRCYHIANNRSLSMLDLVQSLRDGGATIRSMSPESFLNKVQTGVSEPAQAAACLALCRTAHGGSFESFRVMDLFQATGCVFDMRNTLAGLQGSGITCPEPDRELLNVYVDAMLPKRLPV